MARADVSTEAELKLLMMTERESALQRREADVHLREVRVRHNAQGEQTLSRSIADLDVFLTRMATDAKHLKSMMIATQNELKRKRETNEP